MIGMVHELYFAKGHLLQPDIRIMDITKMLTERADRFFFILLFLVRVFIVRVFVVAILYFVISSNHGNDDSDVKVEFNGSIDDDYSRSWNLTKICMFTVGVESKYKLL